MTRALLAVAFLTMATPALAQQTATKASGGAALPAGWQSTFDKAGADASKLTFTRTGNTIHAVTGQLAGIFYQPATVVKGSFKAGATFTQNGLGRYPEGYGLLFNGANLNDPGKQSYVYFLIRQDGKYTIKHRAGADVHTIVDWTPSTAIKNPGGTGKAVNTLAVEANGKDINYMVNGTTVHRQDQAHVGAAGIVGLRINHALDVSVADFVVR